VNTGDGVEGKKRLLAVHAHPDDESLFTGGTLARYVGEGVEVCLVTCTDGGRGSAAAADALVGPNGEDQPLGDVRTKELRNACDVLGIDDLRLLRFADSGNSSEPNPDPRAFINQTDQAVAKLTEVLDEVRPQVVLTYNTQGLYGHRDHVQANRITHAALSAMRVEYGWSAQRFFEITVPQGFLEDWWLYQIVLEVDSSRETVHERWAAPDTECWRVDIRDFLRQKHAAISAHSTQQDPYVKGLLAAPEQFEYFRLVEEHSAATGTAEGRSDLFSGLEV
jgi:LmbE family N-acetylglucosaminyl deacetylase